MLTRLEVDGFKNLLGFEAYFGPYTCIAGANAVGKSNIFDAIHFMSLLADTTFVEAASNVRSAAGSSDPRNLFWQGGAGAPGRIRLAAEMIVPAVVEDDFGRTVTPTTSFLRYEIVLGHRSTSAMARVARDRDGGIELISENLQHIKLGDAKGRLPWKHSRTFRQGAVFGRRGGIAYISTTDGAVNVHQDGESRGRPRTSPASRAPRSVVSTTTTSDAPTILAARREMQQWRILALEPAAMRSPEPLSAPSVVGTDGSHLAVALLRMADRDPEIFHRVAAAASALVDVRAVSLDLDQRRELLTLQAQVARDPLLPARSLSDGTLRFIALCILDLDSEYTGLVCMEEPENGIHPARIPAMLDLVQRMAVNPTEPPGADNPLRQVIVNTHSPVLVAAHANHDDLVLALPATVRRNGGPAETLRLRGLAGSWRSDTLGLIGADISDYLLAGPGEQLRMDVIA